MEEAVNIKFVIWNIISFLLMVFVIKYVVWPKIMVFIEARRKEIDDLIKTYTLKNEEVTNLVEKMRKEASEASERRIKYIEVAKHESKLVREEIIEKAYNEAKSMVERAKNEILQERRVMYAELKSNISQIVVKAVGQILCNVIDSDTDKRIIEETEKTVAFINEPERIETH